MPYCRRCKEVFDETECPFCGDPATEVNEDGGQDR